MENPSSSEVSLSTLLCQEPEAEHCFVKVEGFEGGGGGVAGSSDPLVDDILMLMTCNNRWSDDSDEVEYISLLLEREKKIDYGYCLGQTQNESPHHLFPVVGDWKKAARLDSINYILNARALFGFHLQTAYLAVIYMDRFLALTSINIEKSWVMQLLSLACLSLAAKLQEVDVPALSDFQLRGDPYFDGKTVQRMELLVLNVLDWKMGSITPFAYLPYFINRVHNNINDNNGCPSRGIVTRILQLIIAIMKDINLMDHYPSAVGLSSVLIAWDHSLTRKGLESKIYDLISCCSSLDLEDVCNCYFIMQRLERDLQAQMAPPELLLASSSDLSSPVTLRRRDSPSIYSICSKRRRIEFSNSSSDQNQGEPQQHLQGRREA